MNDIRSISEVCGKEQLFSVYSVFSLVGMLVFFPSFAQIGIDLARGEGVAVWVVASIVSLSVGVGGLVWLLNRDRFRDDQYKTYLRSFSTAALIVARDTLDTDSRSIVSSLLCREHSGWSMPYVPHVKSIEDFASRFQNIALMLFGFFLACFLLTGIASTQIFLARLGDTPSSAIAFHYSLLVLCVVGGALSYACYAIRKSRYFAYLDTIDPSLLYHVANAHYEEISLDSKKTIHEYLTGEAVSEKA